MKALFAVAVLVTVAAITPGPNNFIVMAAAARGGGAAAIPAIAGVVTGSLALLVLVWTGAGAVFDGEPRLRSALVAAGCLYLAWLGASLIRQGGKRAGGDDKPGRQALPRTALGLAAFQFLNPKGWVMIVTATAAMPGDSGGVPPLAALSAIFAVVTGVCLTLWALAGSAIADRLRRPPARQWFERAMGGLLIGSAVLLLI
ncbi:MAG: LysE family translocator [Alphaproteobacteria bacterium]